MKEMASEEAIRFVNIPTRILCYASGLGMPSMHVRDTDLEYDICSEINTLVRALLLTKCLSFTHKYLL